jgi:hypothetical protein
LREELTVVAERREDLHRLIDALPDSEVSTARHVLEYLRLRGHDRVLRTLVEAPADDELTTPEEDQAADAAWQEYLRGEGRPWEAVRVEVASE